MLRVWRRVWQYTSLPENYDHKPIKPNGYIAYITFEQDRSNKLLKIISQILCLVIYLDVKSIVQHFLV